MLSRHATPPPHRRRVAGRDGLPIPLPRMTASKPPLPPLPPLSLRA